MFEYHNRHGLKVILPVDEGVCFFTHNKAPNNRIICLTSSHTKNFTTCRACESKRGIICELFASTGKATPTTELIMHRHLEDNDMNLLEYVKSIVGKDYEPYYAKTENDLEVWLWNLFIETHTALAGVKKVKTQAQCFEQMMICATKHPKVFDLFYRTMYSTFILNRKYMLLCV